MFYLVNIQKSIRLEPKDLGGNFDKKIMQKIRDNNEGQYSGSLGYVIQVFQLKRDQISEGKVQDTTGDVIFLVNFQALTFRPENKEVHDGLVTEVSQDGFYVESGPLRSFINKERVPAHYVFDRSANAFISDRDISLKIRVGSDVRYKIFQTKLDVQGITALSTINENYLGPITA